MNLSSSIVITLTNIVLVLAFFYYLKSKNFTFNPKAFYRKKLDIDIQIESIKVAAEEMISNTNQISKNTINAASMVTSTLKKSEDIEDIVKNLNKKSEEIDSILNTIANITHQTSLLALNASIEAARAGESGKGFAVVANEVKDLSKQTKLATKEISEKIEIIQTEIQMIQSAIMSTTSSIREINKLTLLITNAVEKQSSYNHEIASTITETDLKLKN